MPTAPATSDTAASVEEQFRDVVYGDTELLAAEFDAIIAAEWPEAPADKPGRGVPGRQPGGGGPAHPPDDLGRDPVSRPRGPGIGGWARQRSPPFRHLTHDRQEGR